MMSWTFLLCFTGFVTCALGQVGSPFIDQSELSSMVVDIVENSLKYSEMQSHLDSLSYSSQTLNGESLLDELSTTLGTKLQNRISSVTSLRTAVESAYGGSPNNEQCCGLTITLTEDSRFKQPVSTGHVCERLSSSALFTSTRLSEVFLSTCLQNLENTPALKWQYFGSEEGLTTLFPAAKFTDCGSYDNRFRPWYVGANVPEGKQVVIVVDKSGSMSQTDENGVSFISLARDAAKTVINTLNPTDQFAVVTFSTTAEVFSDSSLPNGNCFSTTFAQATPQNIARVEAFINSIQPGGATYYDRAMDAAFAYFSNNPATNKDRVILFMSDGEPTDANPVATLENLNNAVNNSVVMLTYGMGNADFLVLQRMAAATTATVGSDRKPGIFTQISTPSNLRNEMASYYNFFSVTGQVINEPIWTVPYLDAFGLGLLITASLPVYSNNNLIGVVAADLTIEELFADSSYFKPTETSYTFVINSQGLVINHPNFPYVSTTDPLFVSATAFERDDNFLSIFDSMKSGGSGNKTFVSTKVLPQGDSSMYGVRVFSVTSTYFWKQIPGTTFSLCLVLIEEDVQKVLQDQGSLPRNSFLYHRLDLVSPQQGCQHSNNYGALGVSSVALAARAFKDPELYLATQETSTAVQAIVNYMEGVSTTSPNIKNGVKDLVVATQVANQFWNNTSDVELNKRVLWRYIGTSDGMFRNFPGTQMPGNFDPVVRGWYEQSHANREKYVITPPYRDAASGVSVITLARALYEGKSGGNHDPNTDVLIGSMGVDMVTTYFYKLMRERYPSCDGSTYKCLLIDQGGYVIVAQQFSDDPSESFNKHIVDIEPSVAADLIASNILQTNMCSNTVNGLVQRTYFIPTSQTLYSGTSNEVNCRHFNLIPISGTNSFAVVISTATTGCAVTIQTCTCPSATTSTGTIASPTCPATGTCTCPCSLHNTAYQPCLNSYTFESSSPQPCTPETPDLTLVGNSTVDISSLPVCYEIDFAVSEDVNIGLIIGCVIGGLFAVFLVFGILISKFPSKSTRAQAPSGNFPRQPTAPQQLPASSAQPSAPYFNESYVPPPAYSPPPYPHKGQY